jgi:hydroxyacylglutathione hydrolase
VALLSPSEPGAGCGEHDREQFVEVDAEVVGMVVGSAGCRRVRRRLRARQNRVPSRPARSRTMKFTQYYLDCLSQASYLIGDETTGRAVVVDPRRDIDEYVRDAAAAGLTIELVIETHFHADFLSGHLELAEATGAEIGFSSVAETEFPSRKLADGERISLGDVVLEIRHTPGAHPESISIVVWEHADDDVPYGVLTGDALFIGDVGRPDLLASLGFTRDELADQLYDSLHDKLLTLPDATGCIPAHGAGSACGKNLSTETWSTIGDQRVDQLRAARAGQADLHRSGHRGSAARAVVLRLRRRAQPQGPRAARRDRTAAALDLDEATALVGDGGAILLDGRTRGVRHGHLVGSINVGLEGRYAEFAGSVVPSDVDIVLVVDARLRARGRNRLGRIGFDRVVGYLDDPLGVMARAPDRTDSASR